MLCVPTADRELLGGHTLLLDVISHEHGLAVLATSRADGSVQASVVNAGVVHHPTTGALVIGFAVRGERQKLINLRARPRATIVFRSGWDWWTIEGEAEIVDRVSAAPTLEPSTTRKLLREIYAAAVGGSVEDWAGMDDAAEQERHIPVLLHPTRVYSNPSDAG